MYAVMSFCDWVRAVAILAVCLVLPSMQADPCVSSCVGVTNGDYQSCNGCNVYVTCSNGITYDNRPCPGGLIWDDNLKRCDWASETCPPKPSTEQLDGLRGYVYHETTLDFTSQSHMLFKVKTTNDVLVALLESAGDYRTGHMYEIVIGGWGNGQSVIRKGKQASNHGTTSTRGILNSGEMRPFWISWENGVISVGRGHVVGQDKFMSYSDPTPSPVNLVAVSAWSGTVAYYELMSG